MAAAAVISVAVEGPPPFEGTAHLAPALLSPDDPSVLRGVTFAYALEYGHADSNQPDGYAQIYRRHIATYPMDQDVMFDVNAAFEAGIATEIATQYATILGQLPRLLRRDVQTVVVQPGEGEWSATGSTITIHHWMSDLDAQVGVLEESLLHEAVHVSLHPRWQDHPEWHKAQERDGTAISQNALANMTHEDMAETFPVYYGMVMHPERLSPEVTQAAQDVAANRMEFFAQYFPKEDLVP